MSVESNQLIVDAKKEMTPESKISKEKSKEWSDRAFEIVEKLKMPNGLREEVKKSLETPQLGHYHNEGVEMASHVGRIMEVVDQVKDGKFNFAEIGLPKHLEDDAKAMVERAIKANYDSMNLYAALHDISKQRCMNIEKDGPKTQELYTLDQWRTTVAENGGDKDKAQQALKAQGYTKIGYRISEKLAKSVDPVNGKEKDHGDDAALLLAELGEKDPEVKSFVESDLQLIIKAITNHEMHFAVFGQSKGASRFEQSLKKRFAPEDIDFIYAVCFIDIASSLNKDGKSDYGGFKNMILSKRLYEIVSDCDLQIKEPLMNLGSEAEVLAKIPLLKRAEEVREAMKTLKIGEEDLAVLQSKYESWGLINPEEQVQMTEAIKKGIGQNGPLEIMNAALPKSLQRYSRNLKQYMESKM